MAEIIRNMKGLQNILLKAAWKWISDNGIVAELLEWQKHLPCKSPHFEFFLYLEKEILFHYSDFPIT